MQTPASKRKPSATSPRATEAREADPLRDTLRGLSLHEAEAALSPVQAKGKTGENTQDVHAAARHGASGSGGALPFLDKIQKSFGTHDLSGVRAHTGTKAKEGSQAMGAAAYASGEDIVFGQSPDLHTAAHEAAHIIQQRAGVSLGGGVGKAGDTYEKQADQVADAVVRGESAQSLLDSLGSPTSHSSQQVQRKVDKAMLEKALAENENYTGTIDSDTDCETANQVGAEWVGDGASEQSYGDPFRYKLISSNKLRQYRPPMMKKTGMAKGFAQANYESKKSLASLKFSFNAHVTVTDLEQHSLQNREE